MSTKTLRKRIALVAVTALGAGLLSVAAVPSANAAVPDTGTLAIATTASNTGSAVTGSGDVASMKSVGWITATSTTGLGTSGNTIITTGGAATGLVYAGAKIAFSASSSDTSGDSLGVVVTGGTLGDLASTGGTGHSGTVSVNGSLTTAADVQLLTTMTTLYGVFNVSAAAGSQATITVYKGTGIAGTTTATNGTLVGTWTLTVAAASAAGVVSLADSSIYQQASTSAGIQASGTNAYDTSSRIDNGKVGIIYVNLKDAYTSPVTTGTVAVTATNSAYVNLVKTADLAAANSYAATTSFDSDTLGAGTGYIYVKQPVANTAGTTTVTITHNGSVLATKTLNWNGDIATLAVDTANSTANFANGADEASCSGCIVYMAKDAAGNIVNLTALPVIGSGSTGALVGASIGTTVNTTSGVLQTAALGEGYVSLVIPSSALHGAGSYRLKVTNSAGVAIYSAVQNVTVSNGDTDSFVVSWNKAAYAPGEIATVTYTLKDAYGNLMADLTPATGWAGAVGTTTELVSVGTACSASKYTVGGSFTCKYGVGNVAGAYSYSFDLDTETSQSATIGSITITGSGVTNADVLKAIVSLIASINKQIAALQKALLKK